MDTMEKAKFKEVISGQIALLERVNKDICEVTAQNRPLQSADYAALRDNANAIKELIDLYKRL